MRAGRTSESPEGKRRKGCFSVSSKNELVLAPRCRDQHCPGLGTRLVQAGSTWGCLYGSRIRSSAFSPQWSLPLLENACEGCGQQGGALLWRCCFCKWLLKA